MRVNGKKTEATPIQENEIISLWHEGIGSARIALIINKKYPNNKINYSTVNRVLNKSGLHRSKQESYSVRGPSKLKGQRADQ
jgi:hypothetical protein